MSVAKRPEGGGGRRGMEPDMGSGAMRRVFVGHTGLRAGWSVLLYVAVAAALVAAAALLARLVLPHPVPHLPPMLRWRSQLLSEVLLCGAAFGAAAVMARIERRRVLSYNLAGRRAGANWAIGAILGFVAISALVAVLLGLGALKLDGVAMGGVPALWHAALWFVVFGFVGLFEEFFFRGYPMHRLARAAGFWPAAIATSVVFALVHGINPGENPVGLAVVVGAGLFFSALLRWSGSLWAGIGFHQTWDWGQSFFWGTNDSGYPAEGHFLATHPAGGVLLSGGGDGPEGSVLVAPVFALVLLASWAVWRAGRTKAPPFAGEGAADRFLPS